MDLVLELELIGRLILAALLGFLIGLERTLSGHYAGERTHALAALGCATFMVLAIYAFPDSDPTRIAAGVVTGLGFLGAGMILKREKEEVVHGLTTAAGIWVMGGIGLAIGIGMYVLGIGLTIIVGIILISDDFLKIDQRISKWKAGRAENQSN
ncbi:MAG: MgtC/SapB family protein [Candidatus Hodarchaeota archaeon]